MAWKKSALNRSQTFSCAEFDFMDMLLDGPLANDATMPKLYAHRSNEILKMSSKISFRNSCWHGIVFSRLNEESWQLYRLAFRAYP
jgi:hypothetical protein